MSSALHCNGSRVLTPPEADAIRRSASKPTSRALFDVLLFTGLRFSELRQLATDPTVYDETRRQLQIVSTKAKATQGMRNVWLCDKGRVAVQAFLDLGAKMPGNVSTYQGNLIRWAHLAGLAPLRTATAASNPAGVTARTTRKTLESWLLATYPAEVWNVISSQGHNETTALKHYFNIGFTAAEREAIRAEVVGWGR